MTKHNIGICSLLFFLLSVSLADSSPLTVNLKTGKTVQLNPDFSWNYYVPPVIRKKIGFHNVDFGITKEQFLNIYADKKTMMKESVAEGVAYFDDVFNGYPATLFFYFKQGILVHGEVVFKFKKAKDDDYKRAFSALESGYTKRLGKPKTDTRLFKEWLVDDYLIRLVLTTQDNRLFLAMVLEDQAIPNATPSTSSVEPVSKNMNIDQLHDLIDSL